MAAKSKDITVDVLEQAYQLKIKGKTIKEIKEKLNIPYAQSTIIARLKNYSAGRQKQWGEIDHGKLGALIKAGWTAKKIASEFGTEPDIAAKWMAKWKRKNERKTEK